MRQDLQGPLRHVSSCYFLSWCVPQAKNDGTAYVPDLTKCSSDICKPEYCRILATYS